MGATGAATLHRRRKMPPRTRAGKPLPGCLARGARAWVDLRYLPRDTRDVMLLALCRLVPLLVSGLSVAARAGYPPEVRTMASALGMEGPA